MAQQEARREMERLCERRLNRALTHAEYFRLVGRVDRLGVQQVRDAVLGYSPLALAAWLEDPDAQ